MLHDYALLSMLQLFSLSVPLYYDGLGPFQLSFSTLL
nr:hypothetical protein Q903MT_gene1127 [Picea sitchensis]